VLSDCAPSCGWSDSHHLDLCRVELLLRCEKRIYRVDILRTFKTSSHVFSCLPHTFAVMSRR
jgi:hypothetical protein